MRAGAGGHVSLSQNAFIFTLVARHLWRTCVMPLAFCLVVHPTNVKTAPWARTPVLLPGPCSVRNAFAMHPCSPRLRAGCVSPASIRPMPFLRRLHTGIPARPACASRMPCLSGSSPLRTQRPVATMCRCWHNRRCCKCSCCRCCRRCLCCHSCRCCIWDFFCPCTIT